MFFTAMKRLLLIAMLLVPTVVHALDNRPKECAQFKGKPTWDDYDDGVVPCREEGVKAYVKRQREYDRLAKQGKMCHELLDFTYCWDKAALKKYCDSSFDVKDRARCMRRGKE